MAAKHSRASTLQQRRLIQIGTAVACVVFVGAALGAVVLDRSVAPAEKPTVDPIAPPSGASDEPEAFQPMPQLIATGLSSVYELDAIKTPEGGEKDPKPTTPPQDIVLVAAIGQPGSMMAVIREGASQTAIAEGQRAGSVDVLEVKPGWARVRHNGELRELTVGKPMLMVSDMGAGGAAAMGDQWVSPPGSEALIETMEERGATRTSAPAAFQRGTSGANPRNPGNPGGRRSGGNPGNQANGNQDGNGGGGNGSGNQANGNGNGRPVPGGPKQEDDR